MRQEKDSSNNNNILLFIKAIAFGCLAGAIVCIIALLLVAAVLLTAEANQTIISVIATIIASLGALIAGFISSRYCERAGLPIGLTSALILFLLIILISIIFYDESLTSACLIKLGLMALFGAIGGILGVRKVSRRKKMIELANYI